MKVYDIKDFEKVEKELAKVENCGKVAIFKNAHNKYIKVTIYSNCVSIGNHCIEYDTPEEAEKSNETRVNANSTEHITGMTYKIEIDK